MDGLSGGGGGVAAWVWWGVVVGVVGAVEGELLLDGRRRGRNDDEA
jgi:hypothetical protein